MPSDTTSSRHGARLFRIVKYTLYAMLTFNIYLFAVRKTLVEALDSFGWVTLLGTFEYESSSLHENYSSKREQYALIGAQCVGYALALHAAVAYALAGEWLELTNATAWLLVCAAIGYDICAPGDYGGREWRLRNAIKITLYGALVVIAVWWGIAGDWLNCYDATLWILCFAVVELNIFKFEDQIPLADG